MPSGLSCPFSWSVSDSRQADHAGQPGVGAGRCLPHPAAGVGAGVRAGDRAARPRRSRWRRRAAGPDARIAREVDRRVAHVRPGQRRGGDQVVMSSSVSSAGASTMRKARRCVQNSGGRGPHRRSSRSWPRRGRRDAQEVEQIGLEQRVDAGLVSSRRSDRSRPPLGRRPSTAARGRCGRRGRWLRSGSVRPAGSPTTRRQPGVRPRAPRRQARRRSVDDRDERVASPMTGQRSPTESVVSVRVNRAQPRRPGRSPPGRQPPPVGCSTVRLQGVRPGPCRPAPEGQATHVESGDGVAACAPAANPGPRRPPDEAGSRQREVQGRADRAPAVTLRYVSVGTSRPDALADHEREQLRDVDALGRATSSAVRSSRPRDG